MNNDLSNLLSKINENIIITDEIEQGSASNTYYCKYNNKKHILKYADDDFKYRHLQREYEACDYISRYSSINIPDAVKFVKEDKNDTKNSLAIFSRVNTNIPYKDNWENKKYCVNIVKSGINVLNEIHNNHNL